MALTSMLYGKGDLDQTVIISMRCGQDSDCNPSNAAGVLFTTIGLKNLPQRFTSELDHERIFSHTAYNFPELLAVCETLVRQTVVVQGGRIEKSDDGTEVLIIPLVRPQPSALQQCWQPGPIAGSRFTDSEKAKLQRPLRSGGKGASGTLEPDQQ